MPIIKSAKKRVRVAAKATSRNRKSKRALKSAMKLFAKKPSGQGHAVVQSHLDKASKKGIIHKNKAARLKRKAAAQAKAAGAKPAKATPKKAAAKKPVAKAPATKKVTKAATPAKKSPAKVKKTTAKKK